MSKKEEGSQELFSAGMLDRFRAQRFPEEIRFTYWGREFVAALRANNGEQKTWIIEQISLVKGETGLGLPAMVLADFINFIHNLNMNLVNCVVVPNEEGSGTCVILTAQRRMGLL